MVQSYGHTYLRASNAHTIVCNYTHNAQQIDWFRVGSALNLIKQQNS